MKRTPKVKQISRDFFWKSYGVSSYGAHGGYSPREFARSIGYTKPISDKEERTGRRENWLNDDFINKIRPGIIATWSQIASDIEASAAMPGSGFKVTNLCAIECCLDADNLLLNCGCEHYPRHTEGCKGPIADAEVARVLAEYDYVKMLKYISTKIHLR